MGAVHGSGGTGREGVAGGGGTLTQACSMGNSGPPHLPHRPRLKWRRSASSVVVRLPHDAHSTVSSDDVADSSEHGGAPARAASMSASASVVALRWRV